MSDAAIRSVAKRIPLLLFNRMVNEVGGRRVLSWRTVFPERPSRVSLPGFMARRVLVVDSRWTAG